LSDKLHTNYTLPAVATCFSFLHCTLVPCGYLVLRYISRRFKYFVLVEFFIRKNNNFVFECVGVFYVIICLMF